jgi:hypothetical protein
MITAKHKTVETYLVYRYKQSGKQIDSISFKYLDSLDVGAYISKRPSKYYFCLDGLDFVEVDEFNYQSKKEGEYYKE